MVAKVVQAFEEKKRVPERFAYLFWDAPITQIDLRNNAPYVIERVLEFGDMAAVDWMESVYVTQRIVEIVLSSRKISEKSRNFWKVWYGLIAKNHDRHMLLGSSAFFEDMPLARIEDIAAMKILAIIQRGAKRDFVDLFFALQEIPFHRVAMRIVERYGPERINPVHAGKSLVYFADAETDPDPDYLPGHETDWKDIKKFFERHVKQYVLDLEAAL